MNHKISNPLCNKVNNLCGWGFLLIAMSMCISIFLFLGCAGQIGAKNVAEGYDETVYQTTEREALELTQWAMEQVLADHKISRLKNPRVGFFAHEHEQKGHYKYARFRDMTFIYEVDLVRKSGTTAQGQKVVGYTYDLKGEGDLKAGPENLTRLAQQLKELFEKSGRPVIVTSTKLEKSAPPIIPPVAPPVSDTISTRTHNEKPVTEKDSATVFSPMTTAKEKPASEDDDVFVMLKKLKELRDAGIITEEEFQMKKKELLDRI